MTSDRQWRVWILFFVFCLLFGGVIFRLFEKQVLEHKQYADAAENQSTSKRTDQAPRGKILAIDKDGKLNPLAVSQWVYDLQVSPSQTGNYKQEVSKKLSELLGGSVSEADIYTKTNNTKLYVPPIAKALDEALAQKIRDERLPGVFLIPQLIRVYPEADKLAPQIVGFVGGNGDGVYGLEAYYNDELTGVKGSEQQKIDSLGRLIDVVGSDPAKSGSDLVMTIDNNIQYYIEKKLKEGLEKYQADSGSIVVMNPQNGAILGASSLPSFDPNNYSKVPTEQQRSYLVSAAADAYEPGSVFKPITMSLALESGAVTPETSHIFGQSVAVLNHEIFNAEHKTNGLETMSQVLQNSDNVAMVWISNLLGKDKQLEGIKKYGFGQKTGIEVTGESAGSLQKDQDWNPLLQATSAFGQGISVTAVQLATAYSVMANGGQIVTPHLVSKLVSSDGKETVLSFPKKDRVISEKTAEQIRSMLVDVVEKGHGKRAKVEGIKVGGKTGTAQVADDKGGYSESNYVGTFAGIFPADSANGQISMVVRFNNPKAVKYAESSAAPTFGEIANYLTNYLGIK